jgi:hypothetical protein
VTAKPQRYPDRFRQEGAEQKGWQSRR